MLEKALSRTLELVSVNKIKAFSKVILIKKLKNKLSVKGKTSMVIKETTSDVFHISDIFQQISCEYTSYFKYIFSKKL